VETLIPLIGPDRVALAFRANDGVLGNVVEELGLLFNRATRNEIAGAPVGRLCSVEPERLAIGKRRNRLCNRSSESGKYKQSNSSREMKTHGWFLDS
jgi:hypothetical protein